jgi:hypothetical protein
MKIAMLLAFIVGYAGGLIAGYRTHKKILGREANTSVTRKIVNVFGVLSVVPALMVGTVIGGTLGGGIGESASMALGLGSAGVPLGLGVGLFVVISATIVIFGAVGVLVGGAISGSCKRNAP